MGWNADRRMKSPHKKRWIIAGEVMGYLYREQNSRRSTASIRHFCLLGMAAGIGILLAHNGTTIPVQSRENPEVPTSTSVLVTANTLSDNPFENLAWMDTFTAGTHVPLPEFDLEATPRIDLDQLETTAKIEILVGP